MVAGSGMALICAAATVLVLIAVRGRAMEFRKATLIANALKTVERTVIKGPPSALPEAPGKAAQLFNPTGKLVSSTRNMAGTPPMVNVAGSDTYTIYETCDLPGFPGDCKVVLNQPIHMANGTWWLHAAAPAPSWYGDFGLLASLVGGSLLLVTVTAFGAYWIVSKTLEPVGAISGKLAQITASDLGHRVPVPNYEDELKDLAETANRTLDRAQAAVEQQLRFASDASHDLRSPLTAIRARIEEALMYPEEADWPHTAAALLHSVECLQELVTDLLQIARLDAGICGRHDPVNLTSLVRCELDRRPRTAAVVRHLTPGVMVNGERIGLTRLLNNLLDNAERHAASTITVTVAREGDAAVLEVRDDGEGIAPDQREVVFQRFTRLAASRRKDAGGTGLGLSIARQIAETHRGTLTIEDSTRGARFVLRVPLLHAPPSRSRHRR